MPPPNNPAASARASLAFSSGMTTAAAFSPSRMARCRPSKSVLLTAAVFGRITRSASASSWRLMAWPMMELVCNSTSRVPMGLSRRFTLEMSAAMTVIPPGIFQLVTEKYSPVTFMWDGKPSGFVTDMVREIAARQKIPYNIRLTSWNNAYDMALPHPKVVLFSAERTPEREKLFQWVGACREEQRNSLREERPWNPHKQPGRSQGNCRHRHDDKLVYRAAPEA